MANSEHGIRIASKDGNIHEVPSFEEVQAGLNCKQNKLAGTGFVKSTAGVITYEAGTNDDLENKMNKFSTGTINASTDWNTVIESGIYSVGYSGTGVNAPPHTGNSSYGILFVMSRRATANANGDSTAQIYYKDDGDIWARSTFNTGNNSRKPWVKIASESKLAGYLPLSGDTMASGAYINWNNIASGLRTMVHGMANNTDAELNFGLTGGKTYIELAAGHGSNSKDAVVFATIYENGVVKKRNLLADSDGRSAFSELLISDNNTATIDYNLFDAGYLSVKTPGYNGTNTNPTSNILVAARASGRPYPSISFRRYNSDTFRHLFMNVNDRLAWSSTNGTTGDEFVLKSEIYEILPIDKGGTGLTANPSMLTNLGTTNAANVLQASPRPGVTGTLPISNGGTGASTIAAARNNLQAMPNNVRNITPSGSDWENALNSNVTSISNPQSAEGYADGTYNIVLGEGVRNLHFNQFNARSWNSWEDSIDGITAPHYINIRLRCDANETKFSFPVFVSNHGTTNPGPGENGHTPSPLNGLPAKFSIWRGTIGGSVAGTMLPFHAFLWIVFGYGFGNGVGLTSCAMNDTMYN